MAKAQKTAYVKLADSEKAAPQGTDTQNLDPEQSMEVTVRIRRKESLDSHLEQGKRYSREEYAKLFGPSDEDIDKVEEFAHEHHLAVANIEKGRRSILLRGKVKDFEDAFKVKMACYKSEEGYTFRARSGKISVPAELEGIVEGVFGLDDRPHLRPMFKVAKKGKGKIVAHKVGNSFNPNDLARIYGFPSDATGKGQCIAIIELGGGYRTSDLKKYFADLKVHKPVIRAVSVDGAKNDPSNSDSADGEVMLDIEVAGAVAPGAKIAVYFAPNSDKGFLDAITTALHDEHYKPSVISISWGAAEKQWTKQSLKSYNEAFKAASLLGVTICCAAGDAGSADNVNDGKVHADFPASSPYVLACGGTSLKVSNNNIIDETVWHNSNDSATGGGVSDYFPLPDYQQNANVPTAISTRFKGRGLPDVAGNADPSTGYNVLVDGENMVIGGTSAVAPLMAGLIALANEKNSKNGGSTAGFINPKLYSTPNICRDITEGDNKTAGNKGYKAGKGWDACTGWGVLSSI
jgi:kumamolisin